MKVLITNCDRPLSWYFGKENEQYEVREYDQEYFESLSNSHFIQKQHCHVIEPTWKVMKEAEETGREAEFWSYVVKDWMPQGLNLTWNQTTIYRIKPEPIMPKIVSLDGHGLADLVGKVVRDENGLYLVTSAFPSDDIIEVNGELLSSGSLLDMYTNLDGSPLGKEVQR